MIIPSGYAQANIIYVGTGAPHGAQVAIGLDISGFGGSPVDCAEAVWDAYDAAGLLDTMADQVALDSVHVKFGPNATGPAGDFAVGSSGTGGNGGAAQVAVLVRKSTPLGGRKGRGRMYLPGVPESQVDPGGFLATGVAASYQTRASAFLGGLAAATIPMVLLHGDSTTPSLVGALTIDGTVATQRRRQRG